MIEDLRRRGQLPPGFSATCELRECSSSVDNVATVSFKAVEPGPNTATLESAAISGNFPWQYSTRFFETENLEAYLWERRKGQIDEYPEDLRKMIDALKRTYPESIISRKLGVEIDDITQTLDNLRLQGGGGQRLRGTTGGRWEGQRGGNDERRGGGRGGSNCEANPPFDSRVYPNCMYEQSMRGF
jgi:hypothetical protein